jgi:RNA polymerase sigma factor (sigma-70 family)
MATGSAKSRKPIVGQLRRALLLRDRHVLTDSRLIESFRVSRDEAAFEILVKRHGPMVLGVCRRVIGNVHDAEDAFQAVFLVLAKKAPSITRCELVGNWLYGVAYRTALQARGRLGRRRAREMQVKDMPQPTVSPDYELHELHQLLDQELNKLPDKYRVPIILCDLEGRPRKDVACQLKVPEGTLSSRLATGRQLLARRLVRYGLALSGGAVAAALSQQAASAAVRTGLVATAVKAAALTAAGESAADFLSTQVLVLSQGVLKTMLLHKLKVISLVGFCLVLGGVCAGIGVPKLKAQPADQPAQAAAPKRAAADDQEPIDGALLLSQRIQAELQLSKNQVNKLQAVSQAVDGKNDAKHKQIQDIQQRIEELRKQIAELQKRIDGEDKEIGKVRDDIESQRKQALGKAAPEILSGRAMKRLREIQRQQRGLRALLQDPKVQQMLKIDDEQVRKIEQILKSEPVQTVWADVLGAGVDTGVVLADFDNDGWPDVFITGTPQVWNGAIDALRVTRTWPGNRVYWSNGDGIFTTIRHNRTTGILWDVAHVNSTALWQLMEVLTDAQRKALLDWVGEPYRSPSWQQLWEKYANKKR